MLEPNNKWTLSESGNYCLYGNGYFISYNPSIHYTLKFKSKEFYDKFKEDEDPEETALYIYKTDKWLILNGDFRKEYEVCKTPAQCASVFLMYAPHFKSKWSTV